jgi:NAD(P)-dependent dehydrogenase (short-subunit alcohol dehydrogenase family)
MATTEAKATSATAASPAVASPQMQTVVISGCSRGIGLALVQAFAERPVPYRIIATARDPTRADALNALAKRFVRSPHTPSPLRRSQSTNRSV